MMRLWRRSTKKMKKLKRPWRMAVLMLTIKPKRHRMLLLMMTMMLLTTTVMLLLTKMVMLLLTKMVMLLMMMRIPLMKITLSRNRLRIGLPLLLRGWRQETIQVKGCQKETLTCKTVTPQVAMVFLMIKMRKWQTKTRLAIRQ